jgi:hypothetical protein
MEQKSCLRTYEQFVSMDALYKSVKYMYKIVKYFLYCSNVLENEHFRRRKFLYMHAVLYNSMVKLICTHYNKAHVCYFVTLP